MLVSQHQCSETMSKSSQYVGLDVSLKKTSICVIDDADKIVWRGQVDSTREAIASAVKQHAPHAVRIGLKSGQVSSGLFHELKEGGLPIICVDARHAKAALSLKVDKTDASDAGLAQIMRVGWYREVTLKGPDGQAARALLVARAQTASQITTLKHCMRGILKTFGRFLPKGLGGQSPGRVRAAIRGHPVLEAIIEPTLRVLKAMRAQLLVHDRAVIQMARSDDTARQLMSIVVELDGRIVGAARVTQYDRWRSHVGVIFVAVHDDFRRCGIGSSLMAALVDLSDNWLNLKRLELTVYADNEPAIRLYRKFGFEVEGTRRADTFRDGQYVDSFAMARLKPGWSQTDAER
jgi:RimJ/RimL family protein N-acetyltransferase